MMCAMNRACHRAACLTLVLAWACGRAPESAQAMPEPPPEEHPAAPAQGDRVEKTVEAPVQAPVAKPTPPPPPVEQGWTGLLQGLPRLAHAFPPQVESRWLRIKKDRNPVTQARALARTNLTHTMCDGLVDVRAHEGKGLPPFGWRDRTRGRTWATPTMAAILIRAYASLRTVHPDAVITLGDLSQEGCGNLLHSTLVRHVVDTPEDRAATALLNRARLIDGDLVAIDELQARDFPLEVRRFSAPDAPVRVEQHLVAWSMSDGDDPLLTLRVSVRRYVLADVPDADAIKLMERRAQRMLRRGLQLAPRKRRVWLPGEGLVQRWVQHWVVPDTREQLVTISRRKQRRRLKLLHLDEVRFAQWQARKPGSFPRETRWTASHGEGRRKRAPTFRVSRVVREAGHVTHMAGRDADVSYVTKGNAKHFAVDLASMDVMATWHWFQALDGAADAVGSRMDRILVAPSVKRHLTRHLPKKLQDTVLFRSKIRLAGGHDAHHHIRLAAGTPDSHAAGRTLLDNLDGRSNQELAVEVGFYASTASKRAAAAKPEPITASSPTPDK